MSEGPPILAQIGGGKLQTQAAQHHVKSETVKAVICHNYVRVVIFIPYLDAVFCVFVLFLSHGQI